ncbi:MAG: acyl-CoA dehydrogenase family protein [Acidimicrobiales bacterium]
MAPPTLDQFRAEARTWLAAHAEPAVDRSKADASTWGVGSDRVAVIGGSFTAEEEKRVIDELRAWITLKSTAGYHAVASPVEHGGLGLPGAFARAFTEEERRFHTPAPHEAVGISRDLVGPTIAVYGTPEQIARYLPRLLSAEDLWCQLYSEPGAGSDLAALATRAERDGDEWVLTGQKVWTSGARYADYGYILCRTDPSLPKHKGITAFLLDMKAPGVTVRPLRQMTGGASFNEVFLDGARVGDDHRLGPLNEGWRVALTTLGFERGSATGEGGGKVTTKVERLLALARWLGRNDEPVVRQALARAWAYNRVQKINADRVKGALRAGQAPGPEGSIGKLMNTNGAALINETASLLLGARLTADTGEWGTSGWAEHVLGTPGARIAGGTDEVQRTVIAERALGLPAEPKGDRDQAWRAALR